MVFLVIFNPLLLQRGMDSGKQGVIPCLSSETFKCKAESIFNSVSSMGLLCWFPQHLIQISDGL